MNAPTAPRRALPPLSVWRRRFIARVAGATALMQLPTVALVAAWMRPARAWPLALALSAALHALVFTVALRRLLFWLDDARAPAWRVWLLEVPYSVLATAWLLATPFGYVGLLAALASGGGAHAVTATLAPLYAVALALGLWGATWGRMAAVVREVQIPIAGLPRALDGYRIAQLSDLHCGPYVPRWLYRRWAARAVAAAPDMVCLTGDFVTNGTGYVDDLRDLAASLRAPDGVFACLGNHDYFEADEALVRALEAGGARVLRNAHAVVERGGARLVVAGIDDRWSRRDDVGRALAGRPDGCPVVMLAHDPASWPELVRAGCDLTLSGHTHAGQYAVPFAVEALNLARLMHRHSAGLYRDGARSLYVHRGLGTSGPPSRFGARPEVAVIVLRAA